MTHRYLAFDVETPNARNDRMSAIGLTVIEDGQVKRTHATLINPETHFDDFNIALTGITPEAAGQAMAFPELWALVRPLFDSCVLVAHNAQFDMHVLASCLRDYGLSSLDTYPYLCTVRMGRCVYPRLPNHRLNTMCDALGIPLDHHQAGSDSRACAFLLRNYLEKGFDPGRFERRFDMYAMRTVRPYTSWRREKQGQM